MRWPLVRSSEQLMGERDECHGFSRRVSEFVVFAEAA